MKSSQDRRADTDMHHSSEANYKNPISSDGSCLITVIISLHERFQRRI